MKKDLIISCDLGTSGNKATLFDSDGNLLANSFKSYDTYYLKPGWAEQNPKDWWDSVRNSTLELLEKVPHAKKNLAAISFSGQMMGCCPIDKNGEPLVNAIIWSDQRAYKERVLLRDKITDEYAYKTTGNVVCANYLAAKIMWLKKNHSDVYKNTYKFLQAKDFIEFILTGNTYTDYSDASGTNLFDITNKKWSKDILSEASISGEKLPDVVPSVKIIGEVKKEIADLINLPQGLPVIIGGGDGPCATVGAGASSLNSCYNIFGSSSWTSLTTSKPLYDKQMRTFILNHLDPDLYMAVGTMQSAGASFSWLESWLAGSEKNVSEQLGISSYKLLDEIAKKSEPGSKGVIFLPYLMGERSPYWDTEVKGAFLGLTRVVERKDIIRSVLEGIVFHLRLILEILEENVGNVAEVRLIGGGGKSTLLQKLMADIWGKKIITMKYMEEATSIGAAVAALVGLGIKKDFYEAENFIKKSGEIECDPENKEVYDSYYRIFKSAYHDLKNINRALDKITKD
jgi:D-xylulose kinase